MGGMGWMARPMLVKRTQSNLHNSSFSSDASQTRSRPAIRGLPVGTFGYSIGRCHENKER
jgi:hypothetical protein